MQEYDGKGNGELESSTGKVVRHKPCAVVWFRSNSYMQTIMKSTTRYLDLVLLPLSDQKYFVTMTKTQWRLPFTPPTKCNACRPTARPQNRSGPSPLMTSTICHCSPPNINPSSTRHPVPHNTAEKKAVIIHQNTKIGAQIIGNPETRHLHTTDQQRFPTVPDLHQKPPTTFRFSAKGKATSQQQCSSQRKGKKNVLTGGVEPPTSCVSKCEACALTN